MQQVQRKVQGWQQIYVTSLYDLPSLAKGRYLAAKEFYEWLADGGEPSQAQAYLDGRKKYWDAETESVESLLFALELNDRIAAGSDTAETLNGWRRVLNPSFSASNHERTQLKYISVQHQASKIEVQHLERLLRDPQID